VPGPTTARPRLLPPWWRHLGESKGSGARRAVPRRNGMRGGKRLAPSRVCSICQGPTPSRRRENWSLASSRLWCSRRARGCWPVRPRAAERRALCCITSSGLTGLPMAGNWPPRAVGATSRLKFPVDKVLIGIGGGGHPPTSAVPPCVRVRTRRFDRLR